MVTAALTRQMDYDAGGRLVEDKQGTRKNDPATDYGYDAAGRMDSVVHHAGASATYSYDAFGRKRTIVEAGGPTTRQFYLGGGGTLLEESDGAGAVRRSYLRVAGMPLGAVTAAGDLQWVLSDQIGQAQKLLDASAAVIWDRIATPFGETHAVITGLEGDEPTRFPGQRFEQLTGLHYNFHRHYDPSLGRYLQADPIGLDGGLNLYAYAGNNPVSRIDPDGLQDGRGPNLPRNSLGDIASGKPAGTAPSPKPRGKCTNCAENAQSPAQQRANEIHSVLDKRAQRSRTTAVTETKEGPKIVSSSEKRLTPAQRAKLKHDEMEGTGPGHAETTGIKAAKEKGLTPTGTAASRPICKECANQLEKEGVRPLSPEKK